MTPEADWLAERIRQLVEDAPPLSDQQRVRIRAILSLRRDLPLVINGLAHSPAPTKEHAYFHAISTAS